MKRPKRILVGVAVAAIGYSLLLVVLGWALEGVVEKRVRAQVAYTLRANEVSIDDVDVSLLRGEVTIRGLSAKRTGIGTAALKMAILEVDIAPLGLALIDPEPRRLELAGAHLVLSAVGVATLRSGDKSREISVRQFTMRDSRVTLSVTSLMPGLGQAELRVHEAQSTNVELQNTMSWLYKTDVLDAELHLPGPSAFGVVYRDKNLSIRGSIMGTQPITIPFAWPIPDPHKLELSQILSLAKELVRRLGPELAKRKAKQAWGEIVDGL